MSVFRRADNSRIHFNCVELSKSELEVITKLVEENGGAMGEDHMHPIKFIPTLKYKADMGRTHRVYNIDFIKECVEKNNIVDFRPYRLSKKRHGERCALSQYLSGSCYYKELVEQLSNRQIIPELSTSDDDIMEHDESQTLVSNLYSRNLQARNSSSIARGELTDRNDVNHAIKSNRISISERYSTTNLNITPIRNLEAPVHSSAEKGSFDTALESVRVKTKIVNSPRQMRSTAKTPSPSNRSCKLSIVDVETISLIESSDESPLNVCISPQVKLKLCDVPSIKSSSPKNNDTGSDKRMISKSSRSHQSHEKVPANGSSWIMSKDVRMQNSKSTDRIHPLTEYVECNNGRVPLLRINSPLKNGPRTEEKEPSKNTGERTGMASGRKMPNPSDDSKPGVSGLNSSKPGNRIISDSDINDEETTEPLNICNNRQSLGHSHNNEETAKCKKKRKLYTLNTKEITDLISSESDDETEIVRRKIKMRKKVKRNGRLHRPSDSSDDNEESTKIPNKVKRKGCSNDGRKNAKRNGRLHRFSDSSDNDEQITEIPNNVERESSSDERKNAKRNLRVNLSSDSSDEDKKPEMPNRGMRKHSSSEKIARKRKNIQYAKEWRCKLENDIPKENRRVPGLKITKHEQKQIVKYLCSHDDILLLQPKGFKVWQELLKTGILKNRTAQSLQNHFTKILLPNIQIFFDDMSEKHKKQFKDLQAGSRQ